MEVNSANTYGSVADFYSEKSVLITGGTGFLGKVLIEKLVYSCPNLTNVYVLVRDKYNIKSHERIYNILTSKIFTRIKSEQPKNLKKIIPIVGDITLHDLGLTEVDKIMILNKVSVVFHLAATIKFNEPLKEAMRVNVEGTRNIICFAQKIINLQAFVYMSTAFSNTDRMVVEEILYPPPMKIVDVYEFIEKYSDDIEQVKRILKGRPNTYTFTKALAETLVAEIRGDMPTAIVRPSVVVAAMHEPIRGWIDTWLGPTPVLDMVARGWMTCLYGDGNYAFDIIPVDYVVNATIVAASRCRRSNRLLVYNCCTSTANILSLKEVYLLYSEESIKSGYNKIPLKTMIFTKSSFILGTVTFVYQTIPAYLLDFLLILRRQPTKYVKMNQKLMFYLKMIKYFSSRNWFMMSTRLRDLAEDLNPIDQRIFPCNPAEINWSDFIPAYFDGVRRFLVPNILS